MRLDGVKIGDKHTWSDWNLYLKNAEVSEPEAKIISIEIPGADGILDMTKTLTGDVKYKNRILEFTFTSIDTGYQTMFNLASKIQNEIHGKPAKIILDEDSSYYYEGRCSVAAQKENEIVSAIVISCVVDPYKYELFSSLEDWEWDSFDFEEGIIREYKDLEVNSVYELIIPGRRKHIVPIITVIGDISVSYNGATYHLARGANQIATLSLKEGDNKLVFRGNGIVSVDYRGGSL